MFGKMLGHFEKNCLKVKTVVSTFLATFEEIGPLFILPSGPTVDLGISSNTLPQDWT